MCKVGFMGERCEQGKKRTLCFDISVYSEFFWSSLLVSLLSEQQEDTIQLPTVLSTEEEEQL